MPERQRQFNLLGEQFHLGTALLAGGAKLQPAQIEELLLEEPLPPLGVSPNPRTPLQCIHSLFEPPHELFCHTAVL